MSLNAPHQEHVQRDLGTIIGNQIATLVAGPAFVTLQRQRAWASITFSGTRYSFSIECSGPCGSKAIRNLAQSLPEHEFVIPRYFIADILVKEQSESRMLLEVLAIADPVEDHKTSQAQR